MISEHFDNIKALIIDMDGVLWRDSQSIGNLSKIFEQIRMQKLDFILATNNATRTVEEYYDKLETFGVDLLDGHIINSAEAVGIFILEHFPKGTSVFVVGQPSLKRTLADYGLKILEMEARNAEIVVASLDYDLTYEKLKKASLLIQDGAEFIGTNPDSSLPTPEGFIPGSGVVIGALEIASGKKAKIIGKPESLLFEMALKRLGSFPDQTLAIGDRLETDIAGAQAANIHTALVLSGASTQTQAEKFEPQPEVIVKDLTELLF
ncbi:MAG: HAD-IIA family hydrolase [Brevefilum sp.]